MSARRARARSGHLFDMGRTAGHEWPLEHAPRWGRDHHPWRVVTAPDGIRYASYEVQEADQSPCAEDDGLHLPWTGQVTA